MRRRVSVVLGTLLALGAGAAVLIADPPAPPAAEPVIVSLRTEAVVDGKLVRVDHVAYVSGGQPKLREQIGRLDLVELTDGSSAVTRDEVKFRLLVAGIEREAFRITGAQRTVVARRPGAAETPSTPLPVERPGLIVPAKGEEPAPAEGPVLIKTRDRVKMLARLGPAALIAAGEAQQDGRLNQTIRVRNVDTSKTVLGRVLGAGLVEVEY